MNSTKATIFILWSGSSSLDHLIKMWRKQANGGVRKITSDIPITYLPYILTYLLPGEMNNNSTSGAVCDNPDIGINSANL